MRRLATAAALVLAIAVGRTSADEPRPSVPRTTGPRRPIVLVGLDAADWRVIDPLVAAGRLPSFERLRRHGRAGTLLATPPLVSPIIWTTIASGRRAEDHRVLDFMVDLPGGGQAQVPSSERRVAALWNLFSDAGRSVDVVGWWATWPAEDVRGTIVSDRVAPQLARAGSELDPHAISPRQQVAALGPLLVHATDLTRAELAAYVPLSTAQHAAARETLLRGGGRLYRNPLAHLATVVASTRSYGRIAEALLAQRQPDLLLVYFEEIDSLSHRFSKHPGGSRAIEQAYEDADRTIARLAARVAPETWIMVVSDHGFYGTDAAIREDPAELEGPATAWHRPYGIVAAAEARRLAGGDERGPPVAVGSVTPLDIAPTLLHLAGLPVSLEMPGRVVEQLLPQDAASRPVVRVPSLERPRALAPVALVADPAAGERLQALGYVGAATRSLARLNLGEILFRRGDFAAAERELRDVVSQQPGNLPALLWLAKAVREQGRHASALEIYERALALPGDSGDALLEAVELAVLTGASDRAHRLLAGAPRRGSAVAAVARAIVALGQGRHDVAERELRAALALEPTFLPALERLLESASADGRARDALGPLGAAAARAPGSAQHQALLGLALLAAGDPAQAETRLARALALAPDGASVRLDLARAQLEQKRAGQALASLAAAPPSPERSTLEGAAHASRGEWAEAAAAYEVALDKGSATKELLNALAWARLQTGRRSDAVTLLTRSLALDPRQPEIERLLAIVREQGR